MEKLDISAGQSMDIVADNIAKLKELFPEILTENKIDFDTLKALLGEEIEIEDERYSFNWHGKAQARRLAQTPSTATLRPCPEESVDWDTTQNLFIEGDNLEVLKLLQKSYHQKVKMIYIDPPYNTGSDFVYPDNFTDNIQNYLELTNQVNNGNKISTNTDSSGRFHTDWLSMIYPRLILARNLLKDDGAIFISIDDNEQSNLKKVCDLVFGEENFIAQAVWQKVYSPKNQARYLSNDTEYVLIYSKQISSFKVGLLPRTEEMNSRYSNPDNDPRGDWKPGDLVAAGDRKEGRYIVKSPFTQQEFNVPQGKHWAFSQTTMNEMLADNRIFFGKNGDSFPSSKQFLTEVKQGRVASTFLSFKEYGHTDEAKKDFIKLFGEEGRTIFETLKPVRLIKNLMRIAGLQKNDLFIDFFAGSGTSGQAVFDFNKEFNSNIKSILVQLPEPTEEKSPAFHYGYSDVAKITKQRLKLSAKSIKESDADASKQFDLGFKVFKLDSSNLKPWDVDFDSLAQDLAEATEVVKADRKPEDLLFEILLKYGLDLTLPTDTHAIAGKTVYEVGAGALIVCLDDGVTEAVAEGIGKLKEQLEPEVMRVVFKDSSFASDAAKVNAVQVLKQYGIDDVKSI